MRFLLMAGAALALAGCGARDDQNDAAVVENAIATAEEQAQNATAAGEAAEAAKAEETAQATPDRDNLVGKWIGVEGLILTIEKDPAGPGRYRVTNQWSLDESDNGTFPAVATDKGISFTRPDGAQEAVPGDGDATGMKWLDGKKDCLIVKEGEEGYCRD